MRALNEDIETNANSNKQEDDRALRERKSLKIYAKKQSIWTTYIDAKLQRHIPKQAAMYSLR